MRVRKRDLYKSSQSKMENNKERDSTEQDAMNQTFGEIRVSDYK